MEKTIAPYKIQQQKLSLVSEDLCTLSKEPILTSNEMQRQIRILVNETGFDISYQEHFFLLGFSMNNRLRIFAHISTGGITGTVVDPRIIFSHLLLSGCTQFALAHNHPSGNASPSEADKSITTKLKEGGKILDLRILDHVILVPNEKEYYSFADNGLIN